MDRKSLTRTVKFLDDAIEEMVKSSIEVPDSVFDKLGSALAILDNELRFDDGRVEEIDYAKVRWRDYEED